MLDAYAFTRDNGIIDWNEYPSGFLGRGAHCYPPKHSNADRFFNEGGFEEDMVTNERLKELVAHGPVGVAIYSNYDCMENYSDGIITDADCDCSNPDVTDVNHAVTVIGYGKSD